ncbi:MAG: hypothetical protein ACQEQY_08455 [Halobacteriota archaeon]
MLREVTEVQGDPVIVHVIHDVGEQSSESTMTGDREPIRAQMLATPAGPLLATAMWMPGVWYHGLDIAVGNQWSP